MFSRLAKTTAALFAGLGMILGASAALAQYPEKPISVICPYGAGGAADMLLRIALPHMEKAIGTTIVPEYKSGAAGVVGANYYATVKPDGYRILLYNQPNMLLQTRYMKTAFEPEDFVPLLGLNLDWDMIIVREDSPFKSIEDIINYAKANPGKLTFGIPGYNTARHVNYALFADLLAKHGASVTLVAFENGGKQMAAVLGGQVDIVCNTYAMMEQFEGKLRGLATYTDGRVVENVPSFKELGYEGMYGVGTTCYLLINKKAPAEVIETLRQKLSVLCDAPQLKEDICNANMQYEYGVFNAERCIELNDYFRKKIEELDPILKLSQN